MDGRILADMAAGFNKGFADRRMPAAAGA